MIGSVTAAAVGAGQARFPDKSGLARNLVAWLHHEGLLATGPALTADVQVRLPIDAPPLV
jgi:hypothetical protein